MEYLYDERVINEKKRAMTLLIAPIAIGFILFAFFTGQICSILSLNLPLSLLRILRIGMFVTGFFDLIVLFFLLRSIDNNDKKHI